MKRAHPFCASASLLLAGLFFSSLIAEPTTSNNSARYNFLFLLVDDLGWADIGVNGSRYHQTPHIDKLAREGLLFTQGYAAGSVCSPTRASIMTGRHPVRVDITDWIPGANASRYKDAKFQHINDLNELPLSELTIAEVLKNSGYATFFAGKWHLGGEGFLPTDQGFDHNIGGFHKGSPPGGYYAPWTNPHLKSNKKGEYLTERLTEETINFFEERDEGEPFLAFLSYYNVHTPIQPYLKEIEKYQNRKDYLYGESDSVPINERGAKTRSRQDNPAYASMVAAVDSSVGSLINSLEKLNLQESTIVFFFSDNGGLATLKKVGPTCNLPLRSGKGWLYEGGIREPMIVSGPVINEPGSICDEMVLSTDFFPTIVELSSSTNTPIPKLDGVSLVPLFEGAGSLPSRNAYWHYPHYHGSTWRPGAAIRSGKWKLIEFYEYDQVELYDLSNDIGEQNDLSSRFPGIAKQLQLALKDWQVAMGAKMPQPISKK